MEAPLQPGLTPLGTSISKMTLPLPAQCPVRYQSPEVGAKLGTHPSDPHSSGPVPHPMPGSLSSQ